MVQSVRNVILKNGLLFLLFWIGTGRASGQEQIKFHQINVRDGLSQGQVNTLLRSSDGFVWAGTQDGLNRYDGIRFRQFFHQTGDSASLSNNYVWCLLEDSEGYLWAGTFGGGLCRYDPSSETFRSFHPRPLTDATVANNAIRSLCEYPKGTLWIGADKGLWSFDIRSQSFRNYGAGKGLDTLRLVTIVYALGRHSLLCSSADELWKLDIPSGKLSPVRFNGERMAGIHSITSGDENELWVGGNSGLYQLRYFPEGDSLAFLRHFDHVAGQLPGTSADQVNHLLFDNNGALWVGTNAGLGRLDTRLSEAHFTHFKPKGDTPGSLSSNIISTLALIEPGSIWAGTRMGINVFSNEPPAFLNLSYGEDRQELCYKAVVGIAEDDQGNLWVGTSNGLTRVGNFPEASERWYFECLTPSNTPSMPYEYVIKMDASSGGAGWVSFRRNGFAWLRQSAGGQWHFEKPDALNALPSGMGFNGVLEDRNGIIWLAMAGAGLGKWAPRSGEVTTFKVSDDPRSLRHDYVFCLIERKNGEIWTGTANGGLCRIVERSKGWFDCFVKEENNPASLSSNMVLSIFEDSRQRLWVCTAHGLNLWKEDGSFQQFLKSDGLPNEVVYGMVEDDSGDLWISTNQGLLRFRFDEGIFTGQHFDADDGLQGDEFNQYAFLKTKDGRLCFGGTNGLSIFDPSQLQPYPHAPLVAITDFQLFNESVPIGGGVLERSINRTSRIQLRHNQNYIAFEFAALGFTQPANNQYAYLLEGLDQDWIYCGNRHFASYPNLPPGEYNFRVKAANHDGVWSESVRSIVVQIMPPWWRTWWASLLYIAAAIIVVAAVIRFRVNTVRQLEHARALERERFRKRTARDFHDEAGNRITKLALLTEVARRSSAADAKLLDQMEQNIQALRSGMRDFIWVLDPDNDNLYDTMLRLKGFGNSLFEYSSTRFCTQGIAPELRNRNLSGDERRHVVLIFKEAMNNCAKYAGAEEAVLSVQADSITFSDNGKGFELAAAAGNGLRNMQQRAKKMQAFFEMTTAKTTGTSVCLRLKTTHLGN